ncbi:11174_t:CDS:2 [Paraglomus occultum]|uniref:11174_t:CDS:1 n=1 Tax=Paraglomus occultum TaxID=144539 RepID=A0A9N9CQV6_9GLOM|nr:11174_t:CDS:2 [Paraglomus occultum]
MASTDESVVPIDSLAEETQDAHKLYLLSRSERMRGVANRILYSKFYTWLYLGMALLSIVSIVLSIKEKCPSMLFIVLEITINVVMITEVLTRFIALRKLYWKSVYNIVDLVLVLLCLVTLIFIVTDGCSEHRSEEIFDTLLLVIRNLMQFGRLFIMLRKNQKNRTARNARVDFSRRDPSMSIDFDAQAAFALINDEDEDFL